MVYLETCWKPSKFWLTWRPKFGISKEHEIVSELAYFIPGFTNQCLTIVSFFIAAGREVWHYSSFYGQSFLCSTILRGQVEGWGGFKQIRLVRGHLQDWVESGKQRITNEFHLAMFSYFIYISLELRHTLMFLISECYSKSVQIWWSFSPPPKCLLKLMVYHNNK